MELKVNVKRKIIMNGKEYGSIEEMPSPIREAHEKAVAKGPGRDCGNNPSISSSKIVFNGQEYTNTDSMPTEIRQMYQTIIKAIEAGEIPSGKDDGGKIDIAAAPLKNEEFPILPGVPRPIVPESPFSPRKLFIGAAILTLLLGLYLLLHTGGFR